MKWINKIALLIRKLFTKENPIEIQYRTYETALAELERSRTKA